MKLIKKNQLTDSLKWSFLLVGFSFVSKFIVKLLLAKVLMPEEFGLVTICFMVMPLAEILSDFGVSSVIIQNKEKININQLSTLFWFNCLLGIIIFLTVNYIIVPRLVMFYNKPILKELILVVTLSLLYNPLILIRKTFLQVDLKFKKIFIINVTAIIIGSFVAIFLAINNYGVWSLIYQNFSSSLIIFLSYVFFVKWSMKYHFDYNYLYSALSKSIFDLSSRIVGYFATYSHNIIFAYFLSLADLGYFNFALLFTLSILDPFNTSIRKVFFPYFSKIQNNKNKIRSSHLNQIKMTMLIFIPFISFLFFYSQSLLFEFFDEKWLESVEIIKYLSILVFIKTMNGTPNVIIKSLGYFNHFFYLQLIRTIILSTFLTIGMYFYNLKGLLIALIIAQLLQNVIDFLFVRKRINITVIDLIKTFRPIFKFSFFIFIASYIQVFVFRPNLLIGLVISIVSYFFIYLIIVKFDRITS